MSTQREQLIRRVSRSIVWGQAKQWERESARDLAVRVVDDLLNGSAEGKATERAMKVIVGRLEESA